jgi:acyl-lipid omega-6 desaturase (Delta-12 desaturase)
VVDDVVARTLAALQAENAPEATETLDEYRAQVERIADALFAVFNDDPRVLRLLLLHTGGVDAELEHPGALQAGRNRADVRRDRSRVVTRSNTRHADSAYAGRPTRSRTEGARRFRGRFTMTAATANLGPSNATARNDRPFWREALAPYARPNIGLSLLDIVTSVVPYLGLSYVMYLALDVSYLLVLAIGIPTAGFLLRTYILFHDCTHGSFLPSKRANTWLGIGLGLLVYSNFQSWKHSHQVHHATAGDLDRRGIGDVPTLTVAEYNALPWYRRLGYRLFRNPLVMFGIGPIYALVFQPRFVSRSARPRIKRNVHGTNVALVVIVGALCWWVGWDTFLRVQVPTALMAGSAGVWLFYVQHQFEDVYWKDSDEWSYADAALQGSSYLRLPKVLQFFTGNIGLHHVHHLSARIPNYHLQRAHDENPIFHDVPTLSLWDGLRAVRLKLYDESRGRLVTFAEARASTGDAS